MPVSTYLASAALAAALAGAAAGTFMAGPTSVPATSHQATATAATTPTSHLTGWRFYVNKSSAATRYAAQLKAQGHTGDAARIAKLAARPVATWITGDYALPWVSDTMKKAAAARQQPVLVAYNIPGRDCGSYSAGGAGSAAAYKSWVRTFAAKIGTHQAAVIIEPDAIPMALSCSADKADRTYALLTYAVSTFQTLPHTKVYLDAGNPGWVTDTRRLAAALNKAGIAHADGFSLNVSNFKTTTASTAFGSKISAKVGGKHFVIDTSRNGNGPYTGGSGPEWCNPPGRALGHAPTTRTGNRLVDAWLWVKVPGDSDGSCRPGAPAAGTYWPAYALTLAKNAGY